MKYRIETLHNAKHKEVYIVSKFLNEDGSLTINAFPGKVFRTKEAAIAAAKDVRA